MPATQSSRESTAQQRSLPGVPMRDLLAACAAAAAVSTPPRAPEPRRREPVREHRDAA
ncbi:hypothetical protein [Streptomyces griseoflavus]|uniref:hypothetical protein n=1 Tax=Streptomyces griseoflavus TaxID=35619 RepID=UPI00167E5677|nr:hypothetical protein [Streptomyces griseoflavus]GGV35068.1 hypothetical protein GCM10010293_37940 [Streptomyces griseoflavus]